MNHPMLVLTSILGLATSATAAVITPVGSGAATGSSFENPTGSFDAQPATEPTVGTTTDNFGAVPSYNVTAGRAAYFDFGTGYADITLDGVYLGLKQFGSDGAAPVTYFWSSDIDKAFEPVEGDVVAPDFGIFTWTSSNSNKSWLQVSSGLNADVAHRYLIIAFEGGSQSNRVQEIVFSGSVPEPASFALVALGGLLMGGRGRLGR